MKTVKETTKTNEVGVKQEFNLKESFVLWKNESKNKTEYLRGFISDGSKTKLVGFFNTNKKNPKEPDVRVYTIGADGKQDIEVASLWESITKNEKRILTGLTNDNEKLVAFYGKEHQEMRPYIRAYYKED